MSNYMPNLDPFSQRFFSFICSRKPKWKEYIVYDNECKADRKGRAIRLTLSPPKNVEDPKDLYITTCKEQISLFYCSFYKRIDNWNKYTNPRSNDEFIKVLRLIEQIINEKMVIVHLLENGNEIYSNCYKVSDALKFSWLALIEKKIKSGKMNSFSNLLVMITSWKGTENRSWTNEKLIQMIPTYPALKTIIKA